MRPTFCFLFFVSYKRFCVKYIGFFDNEIMPLTTIKISYHFDGCVVIIWYSFETNYCNNRKLQHFFKIYKTEKRIILSICWLCVPILSFSLFTVLTFYMKNL